jgi:hypothetical protein
VTAGERLLAFYALTRYVAWEGRCAHVATIGQHCRSLERLLERHGDTGVFITAWNPGSRPAPPAANRAAQRRLEAELGTLGVTWFPHAGIGPDRAWPPEIGAFVLGLPAPAALALAEAYGQNAVVMLERGCPAELRPTALMPP